MSEEREIQGEWSISNPLSKHENASSASVQPRRLSRAERRKALALRLLTQEELALKQEVTEGKIPSFGYKLWRVGRNISKKWWFWVGVIVTIPGGAAVMAIASLFQLSAQPNCLSIFWPTASAADRLYCAEVTAQKQTVDDLLLAIDLVNSLPKNHPLRNEINRQIAKWSEDILKLGDAAFQEGKLPEAIAIARKVPSNLSVYSQVEKYIQKWESIWNKADKIYRKAEEYLSEEEWNKAFRQATLLLDIKNTYWETIKYDEITRAIQTSRIDGNKLSKARSLAAGGGVDNLLAAIKLASTISPNSYLAARVQKLMTEFGKKIVELAELRLKAGEWQQAIDMVNKIPESAKLKEEVKDFTELAGAASQITVGTVEGLEKGIKAAKKIKSDRPLYNKVQEFITRWQQEIADIKTLESANQVAIKGGINDFKVAIAQLQTIPQSNPRWPEAKKEIDRLTGQIEFKEDAPILTRADQLAIPGDAISLEMAIIEARKISPGRNLYQQAQDKIKVWTDISQRFRDQPYLDQANQLANDGNFESAIAAASKIQPGRILYDEARSKIRQWEFQLEGSESLQSARQAAQGGNVEAWETAIMLANQVSESSGLRSQAREMISDWSRQIFAIAEAQSSSDLPGAIAILRKIPPGTPLYEQARSQIETWQEILNPPSIEPEIPIEKNTEPKFPR
ncbi:hypothetical protein BCD67_19170 [Oscillatoriales cyanobacterium USR001]|nr:hypothetical protein BCD67_19170 [Oscillatoriales cyanobacterium USR001]